jgi:hypothetical protein
MHPHREKVLTMTYDNGKEFAHHALLADLLEAAGGLILSHRGKNHGLLAERPA